MMPCVTLDEIIEAMKKKRHAEDLRLEIAELEIHRNTLRHLYNERDGISTEEAKAYLHSVLEPYPADA